MKRNKQTVKSARRAKTAPMYAARKIAESKRAAPFNPALKMESNNVQR